MASSHRHQQGAALPQVTSGRKGQEFSGLGPLPGEHRSEEEEEDDEEDDHGRCKNKKNEQQEKVFA